MKKSEIEKLAKSMNISEADLMCLAQSVADDILKDGVTSDQIEKAGATETIQAYTTHAIKKHDRFTTTYLTNPEARTTFQHRIYSDIKK